MNSFVRKFALLLLAALPFMNTAQAQTLPGSTPRSSASDTYSSPIHRANPNSRQGTQPVTPPGRPPVTPPTLRKPTLENGGIGNGYPTRQMPRAPVPSAPPSRSN